jgi:hypothetical protein
MQKARRARAIAIAQSHDAVKSARLRLLVISAGAICVLMALPAFF